MAWFISKMLAACFRVNLMGYKLATYISGKYARVLVAFGAAVASRLLRPPGIQP